MTAALIIMEDKPLISGGYNPLHQVGEISTLRRLVVVLRQSGAKRIVVSGGSNHDALVRHLAHMGVICLKPTPANKYNSLENLKSGIFYLTKFAKFEQIIVVPVAYPLVEVSTVLSLLSSRLEIAIPCYNGTAGFPVVFRESSFPLIENWQGEDPIEAIMQNYATREQLIAVQDPSVLVNLQQEEDWEALLHTNRLPKLRPETKISIARETVCFGPGTRMLLTLLEETNSLRTACFQMGISYSKGMRMVENMEQQLGFEVVVRKQGGQSGGRSYLTEKGIDFLAAYLAYENESKAAVSKIFQKYFG